MMQPAIMIPNWCPQSPRLVAGKPLKRFPLKQLVEFLRTLYSPKWKFDKTSGVLYKSFSIPVLWISIIIWWSLSRSALRTCRVNTINIFELRPPIFSRVWGSSVLTCCSENKRTETLTFTKISACISGTGWLSFVSVVLWLIARLFSPDCQLSTWHG